VEAANQFELTLPQPRGLRTSRFVLHLIGIIL
jgi:hypothetical protein